MKTHCERLRELTADTEKHHLDWPSGHQWMIDHRENAPLHHLYVKYALAGLLAIDQGIKLIANQHKTSHSGILLAMYEARAELILEDAAYWEAYQILLRLSKQRLLSKLGDIFCGISGEDEL